MSTLPAEQGYRMPAEWEPHEATWIAWPHQKEDWPGKFAAIPFVYAEIVRHLHNGERVRILVPSVAAQTRIRKLLKQAGVNLDQVDFYVIPTDRSWVRDTGPIFVKDSKGEIALTKWKFNAWAKYDNWQLDDAVTPQIQAFLGLSSFEVRYRGKPVVLEGGSIEVNGAGLMLTTEECLLGTVQARNPECTKADLESIFRDYLGVHKVLWLGRGIAGDDTHGHIDDLARFVAPNTIVTAVETNSADENFTPLQENWQRLQDMTDASGSKLEIVQLPMPGPVWFDGQRLPASYANFYIANDRVLVPTFNDPNDRLALGILAELFPDRMVVGIHSVDLVLGLGTLHCLTQQQPAT